MNKIFKRTASITLFTLLFVFGCGSRAEKLSQGDIMPLMNRILSMHVSQHSFNDEISERTLNLMLSYLDSSKLYFHQSDIDEFMKDKNNLDDFTASKDYTFLNKIFGTFTRRFTERMKYFDELVKADHNFDVDEYIDLDREKLAYCSDEKELNERWRIFVKYQLLNYMKTGKNLDEAREKLSKKYNTVKKENEVFTKDRIFSIYLNMFCMALDPHTNYLTPEEFQDFRISMELQLSGIGAVLRSEDGFVFVESIIKGGPASKLPEAAALKVNDKIIAVAQGSDEPEEVIDIPLSKAVTKIRGKKGTKVVLTVVRTDPQTKQEKTVIIPIVRDTVALKDKEIKYDVYNGKNGKIGYIKFPEFYAPVKEGSKYCSQDLYNALVELQKQKVKGIVVDLRGNPGGSLAEAVRAVGLFIKSGPVLQVKYSDNIDIHKDEDSNIYYDGPLTVLIDKGSASASEIFAGAIKDYGRGIILGSSRTFGKGTVQDLRSFDSTGAIKVTIQIFYQPSGTSNNLNGIEADIKIPDLMEVFDFDESKMKYPLAWQPIKKAEYRSVANKYLTPATLSMLKRNSERRIKADKEFQDLNKKIEEYKTVLSAKRVSLKKDAKVEAVEDDIRKISEDKSKDEKVFDATKDIFLREAFTITEDYAKMLGAK